MKTNDIKQVVDAHKNFILTVQAIGTVRATVLALCLAAASSQVLAFNLPTIKPPTQSPDDTSDQTPDRPDPVVTPTSGDITVDINTTYQTIDGFGAALPMWGPGSWSESETKTMVGMGDGELGLSIVRTIIRPSRNDWPRHASALKAAKRYGSEVQILASPWTPPPQWKTNNSPNNGGKLRREHYADYANHLNDYVAFMNQQGVKIDVTSLQNEPNWHPDYESCDWSGTDFRTFLRDHGDKIQNTKLMVGEAIGFQREFTDPSLNDPVAAANVDYVAGHLYGPWDTRTSRPAGNNLLSRYPLAEQKGKPAWMTEWNLHEADDRSGGGTNAGIWKDSTNQEVWDETLDDVVSSVHYSMTANWSAYIWWWGRRYYSFLGEARNDGYGTPAGEVLQRGWAFSHYSKYVRPGYVRVNANKAGNVSNRNNLYITAYQGDDQKLVLVLINRESSDLNGVKISLPVVPTAASYTFTSRFSQQKEREITLSGQQAEIDIPARSISTVVVSH